jgi:antitoxin component of MazEF toxin-antitoxin module
MVTKLKREGSGWVLPLDAELLQGLKIDEHTELEIAAVGQSLVLTVSEPSRKQRFEDALADTNRQFGGTLQRLAE